MRVVGEGLDGQSSPCACVMMGMGSGHWAFGFTLCAGFAMGGGHLSLGAGVARQGGRFASYAGVAMGIGSGHWVFGFASGTGFAMGSGHLSLGAGVVRWGGCFSSCTGVVMGVVFIGGGTLIIVVIIITHHFLPTLPLLPSAGPFHDAELRGGTVSTILTAFITPISFTFHEALATSILLIVGTWRMLRVIVIIILVPTFRLLCFGNLWRGGVGAYVVGLQLLPMLGLRGALVGVRATSLAQRG
ncbi:hypothetical protein CPB84DRAFT_1846273 [Gymnopilus junonius]|uniref:Uncharacterized protein n=1 Tax=Gymnopilus junonius TaxID=109634 RepID=A0A9P5TN71_GYMJU|nr:hypothetical protein CPB84DRAFT_1846273 [Gymnopilus junonius]